MITDCLRAVLGMAVLSQAACLAPTGKCWNDSHCTAPSTCNRATHLCTTTADGGSGDGGHDGGASCMPVPGTAQLLTITSGAVAAPADPGIQLGQALAAAGDTLFIGAPKYQANMMTSGGVYVVNSPSGAAGMAQALLVPASPANGQSIGFKLAATADTLLTAPDSSGTEAVYLFRKAAGNWGAGQVIPSPVPSAFGDALAYDGNGTAFIGAPAINTNRGAIYPLDVTTATLLQPVSSTVLNGQFGFTLALTQTSIFVASPYENLETMTTAGTIYEVPRSTLMFNATAKFGLPMPLGGAYFGSAIAIVGNAMLVSPGPGSGLNSAYYFLRTPKDPNFTWQATLKSPDMPQSFGYTIALLSDTVAAIGDTGVGGGVGAVYLYDLTQSDPYLGRAVMRTIKPTGSPRGAKFGTALATSGSRLFIGAPGFSSGSGAVFVSTCQ